jgi:hypothetical protein
MSGTNQKLQYNVLNGPIVKGVLFFYAWALYLLSEQRILLLFFALTVFVILLLPRLLDAAKPGVGFSPDNVKPVRLAFITCHIVALSFIFAKPILG